MNFIDSYKKALLKTSFISKVASFLIAACCLMNVFQNIFFYFNNNPGYWRVEYFHLMPIGNIFLVSIGIIFGARFFFLYSKKNKKALLSQLLWLIGLLAIFAYQFYTVKYHNNLFPQVSLLYESMLWSHPHTALLLKAYFLLSFLKQLAFIVFAIFENFFLKTWDRL